MTEEYVKAALSYIVNTLNALAQRGHYRDKDIAEMTVIASRALRSQDLDERLFTISIVWHEDGYGGNWRGFRVEPKDAVTLLGEIEVDHA